MTFPRGASLPVAVTLGYADTCDLGPTAGNGFYKRWPDDLALLADLGVTDLRLTFDWARLQPKPGEFSGAWVERYANVFDAADAIGLTVWAAMYDGGLPRWFVNEGGLDDDDAVTRWWPRWAERVADRFGDRVDGWIPFAELPSGLPDQVWVDTWSVVGGGGAPVVLSVPAADGTAAISRHRGRFDLPGVSLDAGVDAEAEVGDALLGEVAERWEQSVRDADEVADADAVVISRFTPAHTDPETAGRLTERFVSVVDSIVDDGIEVRACLVEPAIAGPDTAQALLGTDRSPLPAATVYLGLDDD